jgi:hypothetical protein
MTNWEFFSSPPRPDRLWAHPASYPMGHGCYLPGLKLSGRDTDHVFMTWCLVKDRDNFTFTIASG